MHRSRGKARRIPAESQHSPHHAGRGDRAPIFTCSDCSDKVKRLGEEISLVRTIQRSGTKLRVLQRCVCRVSMDQCLVSPPSRPAHEHQPTRTYMAGPTRRWQAQSGAGTPPLPDLGQALAGRVSAGKNGALRESGASQSRGVSAGPCWGDACAGTPYRQGRHNPHGSPMPVYR